MITHVVMMKLKDPSDRDEAVELLRGMAGRIPDLLDVQVHGDSLGRDGAYDLVLISSHADEAGLDGYIGHEVHQEVLTWLRPRLTTRAVVDAES